MGGTKIDPGSKCICNPQACAGVLHGKAFMCPVSSSLSSPSVAWLYIQRCASLTTKTSPFATRSTEELQVSEPKTSRKLPGTPSGSSKVRMRDLKRKRVDAPRVPTLEDVHPHTTWSMCVRVYHKFHVERLAVGRKRLSMVLLDEKSVTTKFCSPWQRTGI
ncbi:hypothetical protein EJB05_51237 [Eragrostis curvula]|uniref:Uncharacterized protein n=1 Tax=Eragrostis curvula TaxID=38414 RepID=A0A5J9SW95_9POAL|nr:hypothetical protein EJB05_51237 [Eragrostis curvula]